MRDILAGLDRADLGVEVEAGVVTLSGRVADRALAADLADIAARLDGVVAVRNELTAEAALSEQLDPALSRLQGRAADVAARLPLFLVALIVLAALVALGLLVARARLWERLAPNSFIAGIYRQLVRVAFAALGLVLALDLLGATALLGTILGAAGIIGLAIGFAVRDTVENFVASVMLSLRQPFRPNDLVEIEGDSGRVVRLTSRATILISLDGNHIRIPNSVVFKGRIVNYSRNPARRFAFDIGIDPDADLEATRLLAEDTVKGLAFVLGEPEALVWIETISEAGAVLRVTGWIDQNETGFVTARSDAIRLVKAAIEGAGVAIPDTTYRIRIEGAGLPAAGPPRPRAPRSPDRPGGPPAEPAAAARAVHRSEERDLIPIVAAEREETDDLLRRGAPQE